MTSIVFSFPYSTKPGAAPLGFRTYFLKVQSTGTSEECLASEFLAAIFAANRIVEWGTLLQVLAVVLIITWAPVICLAWSHISFGLPIFVVR